MLPLKFNAPLTRRLLEAIVTALGSFVGRDADRRVRLFKPIAMMDGLPACHRLTINTKRHMINTKRHMADAACSIDEQPESWVLALPAYPSDRKEWRSIDENHPP